MNKIVKNMYDICLSFLLTLHLNELFSKIIIAIVVVLVNLGLDYFIKWLKTLKLSKSTKEKIDDTIDRLKEYVDIVDKIDKK